MAVSTIYHSLGMTNLLLLLLWCKSVHSRYENDGVYVHILHPKPGGAWSPQMFPQLDVEVGNGVAADAVRASPFSTLVCYYGNKSLLHAAVEPESDTRAICNPMLDAASSSSELSRTLDISPIDNRTGLAVVTAWMQSEHDVISPKYALGQPSRVYLWDDPILAGRTLLGALYHRVDNLCPIEVGFDLEGTTMELVAHLGVARSQEAAAWLRRAAENDSSSSLLARAALAETLNDSREFSLAPVRAFEETQEQELIEGSLAYQAPTSSKASVLERIAFVTISNMGYVDYTINAMATLRINCGMPCFLRTVCVDPGCMSTLQASSEVTECPETVTLLRTDFDTDDVKGATFSNFSNYRSSGFNAITRYKFVVIHDFLLTHKYVIFTDGDIAFLRPDFLDYLTSYMDLQPNLDLAAQCDLMGPAVKDQACFTVVAGRAVDYLCSGFLMVRSNERTKALFKPETVLNDPRYTDEMHDQDYFNLVMKPSLHYAALDTTLFPNGSPYQYHDGHDPIRNPPPENPMLIHFNYFPGKTKRKVMQDHDCWLGSELQLVDTGANGAS